MKHSTRQTLDILLFSGQDDQDDTNLTTSHATSTSEYVLCSEVRVSGLLATRHVYMVGTCPSSYTDVAVVRQCTKAVEADQYSYVMDVPVYSITTKLVYR